MFSQVYVNLFSGGGGRISLVPGSWSNSGGKGGGGGGLGYLSFQVSYPIQVKHPLYARG